MNISHALELVALCLFAYAALMSLPEPDNVPRRVRMIAGGLALLTATLLLGLIR